MHATSHLRPTAVGRPLLLRLRRAAAACRCGAWRAIAVLLAALPVLLASAPARAGDGSFSISVPAGYGYGAAAAVTPVSPRSSSYIAPHSAADPTDPVIIAKATALGHDPAQIFAFVRDQVGIDAYPGSLRGAHGVLAGLAGNAVDRASLAVALLRASGFSARYAQGTLAYADAQRIVARAFNDPQRLVGCNNPGPTADSRNDYTLISEAQAHVWVEYQPSAAAAWVDLDPAFAGANAGQTFTSVTATFDEIPDSLQHHVRFRVTAETFSQASAIYGFGLGSNVVLDQTLNAVDLVDKPVTLGQFVSLSAPPGLSVSATVNTYSPYLMIGNSSSDINNYQLVRGTDYAETFTNFPLGTTLVTGVFVDIDTISPASPNTPQSNRRVLVDRIGYATRETGGNVSAPAPNAPPALTAMDLLTVQVSPSVQPLDAFAARQTRLSGLQTQLAAIAAQVTALPPPPQQTPAQLALRTQANTLNRATTVAVLELMTAAFAGAADRSAQDLGATFLVKPWLITPRLTIARASVSSTALNFSLDIRKNDLRIYPLPGISWTNPAHYERARGIAESVLEAQVLNGVTGLPARSIDTLLANTTPGQLVAITRYNPGDVDTLALSADARARIRDTVGNNSAGFVGRSVLAPRAPVTVNGTPYSVWLETDPSSGYTISTGEDGTHQALGEYGGLLLDLFGVDGLETQTAKFIGQVDSIGVSGIAFTAAVIEAIATGNQFTDLAARVKQILDESPLGVLDQVSTFLEDSGASEYCEGGCGLVQNMLSGLLDGVKAFKEAIGAGDPPVPTILLAPPLPPLPAPVMPGSAPGATLTLVRDTRYFVPYNGAEVPSVYLAQITNTGPATATFSIGNAGSGGPYDFVAAVPQITLAAGASGEVGVCLKPYAALPGSGTPTPVGVSISSPTTPPVSQTGTITQTTPALSALLLRVLPDNLSAHAGDSVPLTLTLDALGNSGTSVTLSASLPTGLTLAGLPASLNLAAGESRSLPLSLHVASGVASGTSLSAQISGAFGASAPATATFTTQISSTLTTCVASAALQATALQRQSLGASLARLAAAMDVLAATPGGASERGAVLLGLDDLTMNQLDIPTLTPLVAPLASARAMLASVPDTAVAGILSGINSTLCGLGTALQSAGSDSVALGLTPAQSIAIPTQPVSVQVYLGNATGVPRVFDLALSGVPAGVSAVLSASTVTIDANSHSNCCGQPPLTIAFNNSDGQARAFDYQVTVTPHDNPAFHQSVTGSFVLRSDIVRVASVSAAPFSTDAGTPVVISTRLMNSLNAARTVYLNWQVRDGSGSVRRNGQSDSATFAPGDGIVTMPAFSVDTSGLAGAYTIEVDVLDSNHCCDILPGGTGIGSFLVGQPFSATLDAAPNVLPPGDSTISYTLALNHASAPTPVIDARSSLAMPASTRSFVRSGNYLYVCQQNRISIVDTQNPDALTIPTTFATDVLGVGYAIVGCNLDATPDRTWLVLAYNLSSPSSFDNLKIVAYDIAGSYALAPHQINSTPVEVPKRFGGGVVFNASHQGSLTTSAVLYNPFSNFIFAQYGNLLTLDFSNPTAAPVQTGELYHHVDAGDSYDAVYGGPNIIANSLARGSITLLATSSAVGDGFGTGPGVGRISSVDTTQLPGNCPGTPNPCIVHMTDIAQANNLFGIAAQGNAGLAVGDTLGSDSGISGQTGQLTLSALDLGNASQPLVQSTLVTLMQDRRNSGGSCNQPFDVGGTSLTALDNNYYAVGAFNPLSCSWVLVIVDANDPAHLRLIPYDVPSVLRSTILNGNKLYALTDTAVLVYDYTSLDGPAITAYVDVPKGSGVSLVPGSFSAAPTSIDTSAGDHDRYTWYRPTATSITWQASVTAMQPGEIRNVANDGLVTFTLPDIGAGSLALGTVTVSSNQSLAITPPRQAAALGHPLSYSVTLSNPSASPLTYALSLSGVPASWLQQLDSPISVPAHGQASATLVLQSTLADPQYTDNVFTVSASASSGFTTSGEAVFSTQARDVGYDPTNPIFAATLTPLNTPVLVGRGDAVPVTFRAVSLGTAAQNLTLGPSQTPPGFGLNYHGFTANAGATVDTTDTLSVQNSVAPGNYTLTEFLSSYGPTVTADFAVTVTAQGVQLGISPGSGTPATTFSVTVYNSGTVSDTFDLSALGLLGPAVSLVPASLTLAPGASGSVAATLGNTAYVPLGTSGFDVQAISRSQSAARARSSAQVTIGAHKAVSLQGAPSTITVPSVPATRSFGVYVTNAGNIEDAYRLAITATSSNLSASLRDPGGAAVQSLSPLRLPGNASAQATVDATLNSGSSGTVTLQAISQSDASALGSTTLTLGQNSAANILLSTPGAIEFGDQALTTTSDVHNVVLSNSGFSPFVIATIALTGANPGDFALDSGSNACVAGATIAPNGGSCTLYPTFTPSALGSRAATINVSDSGAVTTLAVSLHGNGVDAAGHLSAAITPNRSYVQFGHTVNYLISARNPAPTATTGVSIGNVLPAQIDTAFATWLCINAQDSGVTCAANGGGPLSDSGVRVPANGSVNYLLSAPVKSQTVGEQIVASASVTSVADPGPYAATSTPVQIVVFRDGFQAYGDGASQGAPAVPGQFEDAGLLDEQRILVLPALAPPAGLIDVLAQAQAADASGFRIERLSFGNATWLRVVTIASDGSERCDVWHALATPASVALALARSSDGTQLLLHIDGRDFSVGLPATTATYRVWIAPAKATQ